jgi:hypothetical protein
MCELSLEETGLADKRGAEILTPEFEADWAEHGTEFVFEITPLKMVLRMQLLING